ncbi:Cytochrome P450 [Rhynchospora pubera]|uniref:Cytochrome P450 n=1 Tax=Rhynchospora pubera TaxID=906938 RepID=A0AAV8FLX8_9POAL|nr:Cytochrome P450 [Rhynchospora pubera]
MELVVPSFPSFPYLQIISLLLLFLLCFLFLRKSRAAKSNCQYPPGPWKLPLIGSLHHLATSSLPHHALRALARFHGPVMLLRAGETDLVVITSREAAREAMKTQDANFANRPVLSAAYILAYGCTDIGFSNGAYWRQLRRICVTELLSMKRVRSFSAIRHEEINHMLKRLGASPGKSPVNMSAEIGELTNNIVTRAAFGEKSNRAAMFLENMKEALELASGFSLSDLFPSLSWLDVNMRRKLARIHRNLDMILEETLQEHLKTRQNQKEEIEYDLIDVLIEAKEHGDLEVPITLDNIKAVILDMFTGGTDSTSAAIEWIMSELIKNPDTMAKAQSEIRNAQTENIKFDENCPGYLKLVIKEALRMHPVLPLLIPRLCKETCQLLGYTIPSGARVVINAWALGRDPDYWDDAEKFKPERFENCAADFKGNNLEFVPFGAGRRICPGMDFGLAVVEVALTRLLLHFDWELPNGAKPEDLDMTETYGTVSARKQPLYLIPKLQVPLPDVQM